MFFKKLNGSIAQQFSARLNGEKGSYDANGAREAPPEPLVQDLDVRVQRRVLRGLQRGEHHDYNHRRRHLPRHRRHFGLS